MRKLIYILATLLLIVSAVKAEEKDSENGDSNFDKFLKRLYDRPVFVKNRPTLMLLYGYSGLSFAGNTFSTDIAPVYPLEFIYGFTRFDERLDVDGIIRYDSEFAFLRNVSSHLKPDNVTPEGITTDAWEFGIGITDGFGYLPGGRKLILYHSGAWKWSRIDVEFLPAIPEDRRRMARYDEEYRFGTFWRGGIRAEIASPLYLDVGYEHTVISPDFHFLKFTGSWLIENISQRWVDFVEMELIEVHGENWPWFNWIVKNGLSFALYELRRNNVYWPFESREPLNYDSFRVGFTFIF